MRRQKAEIEEAKEAEGIEESGLRGPAGWVSRMGQKREKSP
jgi:hypothetical protein